MIIKADHFIDFTNRKEIRREKFSFIWIMHIYTVINP